MQTDQIHIATGIPGLFSAQEAWEYRLLPYETNNEVLCCYGEDGFDYASSMEELEVLTGKRLEIKRLAPDVFVKNIRECYRGSGEKKSTQGKDFLQNMITDAFQNNASDIHFEAYEESCRVRFRIDGKLIERHMIEKGNYPSLVNQVKILANLDISEKRLPQDGRILYHRGNNHFDIRVSTLPTIHGEKMVLRLLTRQGGLLKLEDLGFSEKQMADYLKAIHKPHGLILISGPTGSGKSTTLYATLRLMNEKSCNILTIEDPVEYTLEGVNQVQLKEDIGLTFAGTLRTFLRQDPDIIMLGEIRDSPTAQMAIRSSLTGHLVFSTIHTNNAWGCVSRLTDMGVHPYLVSDTLLLCVAQRLIRLLCPKCKQEMVIAENIPGIGVFQGTTFYKAVGCEACYYTGYSGRKAIYEVIPVDSRLAEMIRDLGSDVSACLKKQNIHTLKEAALELLYRGETSLEELFPLLTEAKDN